MLEAYVLGLHLHIPKHNSDLKFDCEMAENGNFHYFLSVSSANYSSSFQNTDTECFILQQIECIIGGSEFFSL